MPLRVGIIVGERSGDLLGAALVQALQQKHPDLIVEGILGEQLIRLGGRALFPMDRLAVMGFVEPLKRLPELLTIRRQIVRHFIDQPPDVFIGIDAPDFNLGVECQLKQQGIPVVHYVSPSVWAWRKYRIKKIKRAVDKMLTLFPFEVPIYDAHGIPAVCVGHPMADDIALTHDKAAARAELGIAVDVPLLALLPGSRAAEIDYLSPTYLQTATELMARLPGVRFIVPLVSERIQSRFVAIKEQVAPTLPVTMVVGQARTVMAAADVVLATAGTATLEAMCFHKPLVVAFKTSWVNYTLAKWLVDVDYIALPNLLCQQSVAPEYVQSEATPESLAGAVATFFSEPERAAQVAQQFREMHISLRCDAGERAALEVLSLLG